MIHPYKILRAIMVIGGIFACLSSCSPNLPQASSNEGVIVYEVSFPFDTDNPYINIYPREMTFTFKGDKVRAKLASFAEVVCSELIMDNSKKTLSQYFKVFDEKYKMELNDEGVQEMMAEFPSLNLHSSAEIDSLAGILCKKSFAYFLDRSIQPITLYHTSAIGISAPNWCNQFSEIQEVLLGYEIEQFGKRMQLTAKEVRYEPVSDDKFLSPQGYESLSYDEMHTKIADLVAEFDQK